MRFQISNTESYLTKTCGQFVDRIYSTWLISDGKECQRLQNAKKFLVAATFEKANTYVFAELVIMNSKVSECGENCVGCDG